MRAATTLVRFVVYWDIDGTLLTTARAGVPALEDAAETVVGRRPDLTAMRTAGMTDPMIAEAVLQAMGHPGDPASCDLFLDAYTAALPYRLRQKRGQVLPGILDALTYLAARQDVANVLLTGNMRSGAEAKLQSYGLAAFFATGGFGDDGSDRSDIARAAIGRATECYGRAAGSGVLVGDTPYDIAAGRTVGLRVLALASPSHDRRELEALEPWWVTDRMPPGAELLEKMAQETPTPVGRTSRGS